MTKKLALLVLCLMMMTMMLAACGGTAGNVNTGNSNTGSSEETVEEGMEELTPEPGAELSFWTIKDGYSDYVVQEFEKKYNIKVTVEDVAYWDSVARLTTDGPAGTGADVFGMTNDFLGGAVNAGLILPNDYFEEDTKSITRQLAIDATTYEGILYGYPRSVYSYGLYVNKDLVKDAKLDTWEDVIAFSKQFSDIKNNKYGYMFDNGSFYLFSFLAGYGGYIFGGNETDPNDIGVNNEGAVKGMEFFQSLKEILPLQFTDMTRDAKNGLWEQGKLAINMDGSWEIGKYSSLPFNVAVIPMPAMPGGDKPVTLAGTTAYFVSSYSKYPNAAKLFANFITSKEMQIKDNELIGSIPAAEGIEDSLRQDETMQGFLKLIEDSRMWSSIPEMRYFGQYMDPAFADVWNGADVKATLDKAAEGMKTSIMQNKK